MPSFWRIFLAKMNKHRGSSYRGAFMLTAVVGAAFVLPGCYQRVTRSQGIGSNIKDPEVYESRKPGPVENFIFGDDERPNKR